MRIGHHQHLNLNTQNTSLGLGTLHLPDQEECNEECGLFLQFITIISRSLLQSLLQPGPAGCALLSPPLSSHPQLRRAANCNKHWTKPQSSGEHPAYDGDQYANIIISRQMSRLWGLLRGTLQRQDRRGGLPC